MYSYGAIEGNITILKMTDTGREHPIAVQVERVKVRDHKSALQSDRGSIACGQHFKIFKSLSCSVPRPNVICPQKTYVPAREISTPELRVTGLFVYISTLSLAVY